MDNPGDKSMDTSGSETNDTNSVFHQLCLRSADWEKESRTEYPVSNNRIGIIGSDDETKRTIVKQCMETCIVAHKKVKRLVLDFLNHKRVHGSFVEQSLYLDLMEQAGKPFDQETIVKNFLKRLVQKRPLYFFTSNDITLTRTGTRPQVADGAWYRVGTESEDHPLVLADYLSYHEMQISALIGVSCETYFINAGGRNNYGGRSDKGTFIERGIYVGLVGARFERPDQMETLHIKITEAEHAENKGYGRNTNTNELLRLWYKFYFPKGAHSNFMTYDEAKEQYQKQQQSNAAPGTISSTDATEEFLQENKGRYSFEKTNYFNITIFKKRIELSVETLFYEAESRVSAVNKGKKEGEQPQKAYVHVVGLGLGVWQVTDNQGLWFLEVILELVAKRKFPNISHIDFSWFHQNVTNHYENIKDKFLPKMTALGNNITIMFSKHDPAQLTEGKKDKLLVACYAWDSNSFPGNEYWAGMLAASGDPAAACCSTIGELQNPYVNPYFAGEKQVNVFWAGLDDGEKEKSGDEEKGKMDTGGSGTTADPSSENTNTTTPSPSSSSTSSNPSAPSSGEQ